MARPSSEQSKVVQFYLQVDLSSTQSTHTTRYSVPSASRYLALSPDSVRISSQLAQRQNSQEVGKHQLLLMTNLIAFDSVIGQKRSKTGIMPDFASFRQFFF